MKRSNVWIGALVFVLAACTTTTGSGGTTVGGTGGTGGTGVDASSKADGSSSGSDTEAPLQLFSNYAVQAQFPEGGAFDVSGKALFVGSLGDGSVHRINAVNGAEKVFFVKKVTVHGPFEDDAPLGGADGMDYRNGSVYVAFTSKLVRVVPRAADWAEGDATRAEVALGMTAAINTPDGLFLLNGQSIRFALKQEPDPFTLGRYLGAL